jgi:hypothetical protein
LLVVPVTVAAAWLPFLALRLVEELLRRHASWWLKRFALVGALGFSVAAVVTGAFFPRTLLVALAVFQAAMLLWLGLFLLRERRGLAPAEARLANVFALALLVGLPFAVSDFRAAFPDIPVRMGGVGLVLFLVATSRLVAGLGAPRLLVMDLASVAACGAVVTGGAALLTSLGETDLWRLFAVTMAAAGAMLGVQRLREARLMERLRPSILPALARLPDGVDEEALVAAHPLTASGALVDLSLYDAPAVAGLAQHRVVTAFTPLGSSAEGAARNLLDEHAATHLVRLSREPPRFLALASGQIGGGSAMDVELDILSRLAEGAGR